MPTAWPADIAPSFRLTRRFGRPRLDLANETVRLELIDMKGLATVSINGRAVEHFPFGIDAWTVPLTSLLLARNALDLEIDLNGLSHADLSMSWGSVALVIGP